MIVDWKLANAAFQSANKNHQSTMPSACEEASP
jgi:hypothetical protein